MTRLLLAPAVAAVLAVAALPAHAYPTRDYLGGCSFSTVNDRTPDGTLGGENRFTGVMSVVVVATDIYGIPVPTAQISADCEIYVNGVLTDAAMSASGVGAAAAAGTVSFEAGPTDTVELCERVVVDGEEFGCYRFDDPQVPPKQVQGLIELANDTVFRPLVDPLVCPVLGSLSPGVPGVLDITPEGDAGLVGGTFWDCPPYDG